MKLILSLLTVVTFGLVSATANAAPSKAGYVPQDWYMLPEDGGPSNFTDSFTSPDADLAKNLQRIFGVQRDAISSAKTGSLKLGAPSNKPADWVPWRFAFFATDLSVSGSGLIGVLGFKGTPSISVQWAKRAAGAKKEAPVAATESSKEAPSFFVDEKASKAQLEKQVDAIHKTVVATGRVKDSKTLRSELTKTVHRFHDMTQVVSASSSEVEWFPARLRLDIDISATGRLKWGTVGGAVKVRLEWYRIMGPAGHAPLTVAKLNATQKSFRGLVGSVTEDLMAVSSNAPAAHFWASDFNIGLGITAKGNVGIAKGSASAFGYLYFNHNKKPKTAHGFLANNTVNKFDDVATYLVDTAPTAKNDEYAKRNGIEVIKEASFNDGVDASMYRVDRGVFRTGLKRAFKIGNYFAEQAHSATGKDWAILAIKPGFAIGLSGDVGLVSLTGSISATISFVNTNF